MNLNLNLPQKKVEVFALFLGSVLIACALSQSAYFLIQHKLPSPASPLPFWSFGWSWLIGIYLATQVHNRILRVAILSWVISMVISWLSRGNEGMAAWFIYHGFHLLAGFLMVIVGIRLNRYWGYIGALLLMLGLSVIQYHAAYSWAKALETIPRH